MLYYDDDQEKERQAAEAWAQIKREHIKESKDFLEYLAEHKKKSLYKKLCVEWVKACDDLEKEEEKLEKKGGLHRYCGNVKTWDCEQLMKENYDKMIALYQDFIKARKLEFDNSADVLHYAAELLGIKNF